MTLKHIALDIGNVICYANMDPFIKAVSETFNVSLDTSTRFLRNFQQVHDLGLTTMERELRRQFGCNSEVTLKKLSDTWSNSVYPSTYMLAMLRDLQQNHGVKIALLSNIGVEHAEMMPQKLASIYDESIKHFSCFVGARKPTMLYYQSFLLQHPEFKYCLYLDDLQENLDNSKQFGFITAHFDLNEGSSSSKIDGIRSYMLQGLMTHDISFYVKPDNKG